MGDELLHAVVDRTERILAQHGALGLVVQLQVDPIHRVVAALLLRVLDEVPAELGPGALGWLAHGPGDVLLADHPLGFRGPLHQVVQPTAPVDVVVRQVEQRHFRR